MDSSTVTCWYVMIGNGGGGTDLANVGRRADGGAGVAVFTTVAPVGDEGDGGGGGGAGGGGGGGDAGG